MDEQYVFTGAMSVAADTPGRIIGLVAAVCPVDRAGTAIISFHRAGCGVEEHDGHVDIVVSEDEARRLLAELTRVVNRAEHLRALHGQGVLAPGALRHVDDVETRFRPRRPMA